MRPDRISPNVTPENYRARVRDYFRNMPDEDYADFHYWCHDGLGGELMKMENYLIDVSESKSKRRHHLRKFVFNWLKRNIDQLS